MGLPPQLWDTAAQLTRLITLTQEMHNCTTLNQELHFDHVHHSVQLSHVEDHVLRALPEVFHFFFHLLDPLKERRPWGCRLSFAFWWWDIWFWECALKTRQGAARGSVAWWGFVASQHC